MNFEQQNHIVIGDENNLVVCQKYEVTTLIFFQILLLLFFPFFFWPDKTLLGELFHCFSKFVLRMNFGIKLLCILTLFSSAS